MHGAELVWVAGTGLGLDRDKNSPYKLHSPYMALLVVIESEALISKPTVSVTVHQKTRAMNCCLCQDSVVSRSSEDPFPQRFSPTS